MEFNKANLVTIVKAFTNNGILTRINFGRLIQYFGNDVWNWEVLFEENDESEITEDRFNLAALERNTIIAALSKADRVQKEAAILLGITPKMICYKIQKYNLKDYC